MGEGYDSQRQKILTTKKNAIEGAVLEVELGANEEAPTLQGKRSDRKGQNELVR